MKKFLPNSTHHIRLAVGALALTLAVVALAALVRAATAYADLAQRSLNLPALGLVLAGTLMASCISYSTHEVKRLCLRWPAGPRRADNATVALEQLTHIARLWLHADPRKLEHALATLANPVLRTGVQLLVNQTPQHQALELLHARLNRLHSRDLAQMQMLRAMAGFASTFGVVASVLSLVSMASHLGDYHLGAGDLTELGPQLATALMGACYGVVCAALVFRPLALRLERRSQQRLATMQLVVQGVAMLYDQRSPAALRDTLQTLLETEEASAVVAPHHSETTAPAPSHAEPPRQGVTPRVTPRAATRPSPAQPARATASHNTRPARLLHGSHATLV